MKHAPLQPALLEAVTIPTHAQQTLVTTQTAAALHVNSRLPSARMGTAAALLAATATTTMTVLQSAAMG